uniref:Uncharacterized protein n=1 Tax=Anguilla anguilla TaxID=7936 RepID=A0A0E9WIS4_ANGAN
MVNRVLEQATALYFTAFHVGVVNKTRLRLAMSYLLNSI